MKKLYIDYEEKEKAKSLFRAASLNLYWNKEKKHWETDATDHEIFEKITSSASLPVWAAKIAFNFLDKWTTGTVDNYFINSSIGRNL